MGSCTTAPRERAVGPGGPLPTPSVRPLSVVWGGDPAVRAPQKKRRRRRPYGDSGLPVFVSVMILPQVHLRKPCYDFYFL